MSQCPGHMRWERTIEGVIEEVDEEDGGRGELQLGKREVAYFGVGHLELALWRRLVCERGELGGHGVEERGTHRART